MKRQTKKAAPTPWMFERVEVFPRGGAGGDFGGEDIRGADGSPVYPGVMVRNPSRLNPNLGVRVPSRVGRVTRLYRTTSDGPVFAQTDNGHTFRTDRVIRSRAEES